MNVDIRHLIKKELVFQLIFLYFLSFFYMVGQMHASAWTGNGSGWRLAPTSGLCILSDGCSEQQYDSGEQFTFFCLLKRTIKIISNSRNDKNVGIRPQKTVNLAQRC